MTQDVASSRVPAADRTDGSASSVESLLTPASTGRRMRDKAATVAVSAAFVVALIPLAWVLWTVIARGAHTIGNMVWWTHSQNGMTYRRPGGGAYHAIVGSVMQVLVCSVIAVPLALLTAVYLVEYGKGRGRLANAVAFMVDVLTGIPSIVAALFIYSLVITTLGFQRQGFAVSLALVLLMIPVVVRTTEEMLKLVPNDLREASLALGVPQWKTIMKIVIPTALPGIVTGIMLGIARVIGETAPLLILVGYSKAINTDLFHGFQGSLPTMIVNEATNYTLPASADRVWGAALTLILIVLALSIGARLVARFTSVSAKKK
jgi:phosphate transport system permease protein